jgi:hypothetical protein
VTRCLIQVGRHAPPSVPAKRPETSPFAALASWLLCLPADGEPSHEQRRGSPADERPAGREAHATRGARVLSTPTPLTPRTLNALTVSRVSQGCSASPHSEDNLFVWSATIFVRPLSSLLRFRLTLPTQQGPDESPWEVRSRYARYPACRAMLASRAAEPDVCSPSLDRAASSLCALPSRRTTRTSRPACASRARCSILTVWLSRPSPFHLAHASRTQSSRMGLCAWMSSRMRGAPSTTSVRY